MYFAGRRRSAATKPTIEALVAHSDNEEGDQEDTDADEQRDRDLVRRLLVNYAKQIGGTAATLDTSVESDDVDHPSTTKEFGDFSFDSVSEQLSDRFHQFTSQFSGDDQIVSCLICLESIQRKEATWNCRGCYEVYHLMCAQKWCSQAIQLAEMREEKIPVWCCPKCRLAYNSKDRPTRYFCFCGKTQDPPPDSWLLAHSCGEVCDKVLDGCKHKCLLLCHPGPCPPCPKVVSVQCYCGNQACRARRCGQAGWSCGQQCGRPLNCMYHQCSRLCHADECSPCKQESKRPCRCGKMSAVMPCVDGDWNCEQPCGALLSCKNHNCTVVCHAGQCPTCVRPGQNSCPCGKQTYGTDIECVDQLPCCGDTCAKILDCGVHECFEPCHRGDCPPCTQEQVKRCRCGGKQREMACNKLLLCDSKCKKRRQCGRHPCSRRCCDGECPPCEQQCGRTLNCGQHKCLSPCHEGSCYPCQEVAEVCCPCGGTRVRVACGRQRKTRPPRCRKSCAHPPDCHHEQRDAHSCHGGRCPPCRQQCSRPLRCQKHSCQAQCHSAILVDVNAASKAKAATPWEKPETKLELQDLECPPCHQPVSVTCNGHHETGSFPCCEARDYSCGRKCGRTLKCGNHTCSKECHKTPMDVNDEGADCDECNGVCDQERPKGCVHRCVAACHPGLCPPCRQMVKQRCHCELNFCYIKCSEWIKLNSTDRDARLECGNACPKLMTECGHKCVRNCHKGACSTRAQCKTRVQLKCQCGTRSEKKLCNQIVDGVKYLDCNSDCEAAARMKRESAEEQARSSVDKDEDCTLSQNAQSTLGGKRIRKRKERSRNNTEEPSIFEKYRIPLAVAAGIVAVVCFLVWNNM